MWDKELKVLIRAAGAGTRKPWLRVWVEFSLSEPWLSLELSSHQLPWDVLAELRMSPVLSPEEELLCQELSRWWKVQTGCLLLYRSQSPGAP